MFTAYFILSNEAGKFRQRGPISDLPDNILEYLDDAYMLSIWNIKDADADDLVNALPYGHHPSFAFSSKFEELCIGDYV